MGRPGDAQPGLPLTVGMQPGSASRIVLRAPDGEIPSEDVKTDFAVRECPFSLPSGPLARANEEPTFGCSRT